MGKNKIDVPENATPKYYKACSVPYALKGAIECELDKLVSQEIFKPVIIPNRQHRVLSYQSLKKTVV